MGWFRRGVIPAFLFMCAVTLASASHAKPQSAKTVFNTLNACAKSHAIDECREHVTASSVALFDRFNSYGLASCLPQDVTFVSELNSGGHTIIRAKTTHNGKVRFMRLIFSLEEDSWKLDVPESLHRSMGEKWEKQLAMTEALYLALREQMGGKLDCNTAQSLAQ